MKYVVVKEIVSTNPAFQEWKEEKFFKSAGITPAQIARLEKEGYLEKKCQTLASASNGFKIENITCYKAKQ